MLSGLSTSGHLGRVVVGRQQKKLNILNWIEKTNRQNQTNQKRDRAEQKNELYYNSPPLLSTNGSDRHSSLSVAIVNVFSSNFFVFFFSHVPSQSRLVIAEATTNGADVLSLFVYRVTRRHAQNSRPRERESCQCRFYFLYVYDCQHFFLSLSSGER